MKHIYSMLLGLFLCGMVSAQAVNEPAVKAGEPTSVSTSSRNFSTSNIYYGDNMAPYIKERLGIDLFATYPSFPHFVNTNNQNQDVIQYRKQVYEWIKGNPDFAKKYGIDIKLLEKEESQF